MAKKQSSPRQRAWQSMRILTIWPLGEIESTAEISRSNLDKYLAALIAAGYVRCVQPRKSGIKGGYAMYRLIRNTGPVAPTVINYGSVLKDNNTGKLFVIAEPKRPHVRRNAKPNRQTSRCIMQRQPRQQREVTSDVD